jgi:DNA end-binding protein Ku
MAARPIASGNISFGLVSIPVRLFTATQAKSVSFNQLHAKDKSRIQQKIYCPVDDAIVDRSELVRGYEVEKGQYVVFTEEELKSLEARDDHAIEIQEFVPLAQVDPVYFEDGFYVGCEPNSARAYRLLAEAMASTQRVALARFTMRGKEHLVLMRPYAKGLMLHTLYYADEIRAIDEIDRGQNAETKEGELDLAKRLVSELTQEKFEPAKYHDGYRERVIEAAQRKVEGREVTEAAPEVRKAQVIDLMAALKASLDKRAASAGSPSSESRAEAAAAQAKGKSAARAASRATPERRRAGAKK